MPSPGVAGGAVNGEKLDAVGLADVEHIRVGNPEEFYLDLLLRDLLNDEESGGGPTEFLRFNCVFRMM